MGNLCVIDVPVLDPAAPLNALWKRPVCELATLDDARVFVEEERERYRLHSLLVMALIAANWNGNKRRNILADEGTYPWRAKQLQANGMYVGGDYLGHNIACVAVDGRGEVIDFDFNHNEVFNSSVEHAESRLVRRVFSLAQIYDGWATKDLEPDADAYYATTLNKVTIFTSLESCAQCAGIMALGTVKEIVYLQHDPGMYLIGNILRRLTSPGLRAPLPIAGDEFGFEYYTQLNEGFRRFFHEVGGRPFCTGKKKNGSAYEDKGPSITSFLCTDDALDVFQRAREELASITLKFPTFQPTGALSNADVLVHVRRFLAYASRLGRRGTSHKL